jgi:hypothetical protein
LPVVAVIICIALVAFLIVPQFFKILDIQKQNATKQEKLTFLNNKATTLSQVNVASYQDDVKVALKAIPTEQNITSVRFYI